MKEIDLKDKKILYELDINSRTPYSTIGKRVKLSKNTVRCRVNKMIDLGYIKSFYTIIDSFKLGFQALKLYLNYQYSTPKIENEIIKEITSDPYIWGTTSIEGKYDIVICIWVKKIEYFRDFYEKIIKKYRDYLNGQKFGITTEYHEYNNSFLFLKNKKNSKMKLFKMDTCAKKVNIDDTDIKILRLIDQNARLPIVSIAEELDIYSDTVKRRLERLIKNKIIMGFRTDIDLSKFGFKSYKVDINLKDYDKRKEILKKIERNPYLVGYMKSIAISDLELIYYIPNEEDILKIIKDSLVDFTPWIRDFSYIHPSKVHKLCYLPQTI
jgi:Lrp/AsnC family transcriptional regulator for asnA, asnC and gidA